MQNTFCCDELKAACDSHLASLVCELEDAMLLIDYGLEETAHFLVAACLQVFLREQPSSLHNSHMMRLLCTSEARQRLAMSGHSSFVLYHF